MLRYCSAARAAAIASIASAAAIAACTSTSQEVIGVAPTSKCSTTVSASPTEFGADGGEGHLTVTTARDCQWDARDDAPWVTITPPAEMQGSGTATFVVAATGDPVARSASLTVGDQHVTISQHAAACHFQLSSLQLSLSSTGGGADVNVTASNAACEWTAQGDADWLTIATGRTYKGNARVTVQAGTWTGPARHANVTVADQRVVLTQSDGCTFAVSPPSAAIPGTGGRTTVSVATGAGCAWSAVSTVPWVHLATGSTGTGPGSTDLAVDPNLGPARTTTVTAANHSFTITQASGCEYRFDPPGTTFAAGGGAAAITMNTTSGCSWTAASEADWLAITGGQAGNGSGTISINLSANIGPQRSTQITAGGQRFAATQASGCTYSLQPQSWNFPAAGATDWVVVLTTPSCPWTASSQAPWLTVTTGAAGGTGYALVSYVIAPNPGPPRTGTLTIGGQIFTAIQAGQ
jgi:trimeric autotransporter adhesin